MEVGQNGAQAKGPWPQVLEQNHNICYDRTMNHHNPVKLATAKVTTVGNSVGISLPKEVLARLRVSKGDSLYFTETPDGVLLTAYADDFARAMEAAERIMRENRDALRELAK